MSDALVQHARLHTRLHILITSTVPSNNFINEHMYYRTNYRGRLESNVKNSDIVRERKEEEETLMAGVCSKNIRISFLFFFGVEFWLLLYFIITICTIIWSKAGSISFYPFQLRGMRLGPRDLTTGKRTTERVGPRSSM